MDLPSPSKSPAPTTASVASPPAPSLTHASGAGPSGIGGGRPTAKAPAPAPVSAPVPALPLPNFAAPRPASAPVSISAPTQTPTPPPAPKPRGSSRAPSGPALLLEIPFTVSPGFAFSHIQGKLTSRQALAARYVRERLAKDGAELRNRRPVRTTWHAAQWVFERIADAMEAEGVDLGLANGTPGGSVAAP